MSTAKPSAPIPSPDDLLDTKAVQAASGNRGVMTLHRWRKDPEIRFPAPDVVIGGKNFWRRRTITSWSDRIEAEQKNPKLSAAVVKVQARRKSPTVKRFKG